MRIVLISLPGSIERRAAAIEQFATAGLEFEFFDGINGSTAKDPLFEEVDHHQYLLNAGRPPSAGEIGCHASHRAVWQYCVELNEPLIVLEDDAKIEANFTAAVNAADELISEFNFIRLEPLGDAPKVKVCGSGIFTLYYCKKYPHDATGYAINPTAARALVTHSRVLTAPADKFIKNFWQHGQALYCLLPDSITPGALSEDSNIEGREKPKARLGLSLQRSLYKISSVFRRAAFNWRHQP
jgi:glycosyl transferase family 25